MMRLQTLGVLALGLAAAGCQSSTPAPTAGSVRQTAATAPADLQLTCSSAAAQQFGTSADQVLPTASAPTGDGGGFDVTLTLAGGSATCTVLNDGTVVSVVRI